MIRPGKLFPIASDSIRYSGGSRKNRLVKAIGEFRSPRKGEWFISGASPEGYYAPNDVSTRYYIAQLIAVE